MTQPMPSDAVVDDALDVDLIQQQLSTDTVGRRIYLYEQVASTNETLHRLADSGTPEGTVVLAESQTAGRGRAHKPWHSPPGVNLYASILLRPNIAPAAAPVFAFVAGLALADTIREQGPAVAIKWPNDVLVQHRKVAGVRAELVGRGDTPDYVILGVGVNLNVSREALRAALGEAGQAATSLRDVLGRAVDRNAFAASFLGYLEEWCIIFREQGVPAVLTAWRDLDVVTGRRVEVRDGGRAFDGRALGVDGDGHLRVADAHGRVHVVISGEIRLVE